MLSKNRLELAVFLFLLGSSPTSAQDHQKTDQPKTDQSMTAPPKEDPSKTDPSKTTPSKADPSKTDASNMESSKTAQAKGIQPKIVNSKTIQSKTVQSETVQTETTQTETVPPESTRPNTNTSTTEDKNTNKNEKERPDWINVYGLQNKSSYLNSDSGNKSITTSTYQVEVSAPFKYDSLNKAGNSPIFFPYFTYTWNQSDPVIVNTSNNSTTTTTTSITNSRAWEIGLRYYFWNIFRDRSVHLGVDFGYGRKGYDTLITTTPNNTNTLDLIPQNSNYNSTSRLAARVDRLLPDDKNFGSFAEIGYMHDPVFLNKGRAYLRGRYTFVTIGSMKVFLEGITSFSPTLHSQDYFAITYGINISIDSLLGINTPSKTAQTPPSEQKGDVDSANKGTSTK